MIEFFFFVRIKYPGLKINYLKLLLITNTVKNKTNNTTLKLSYQANVWKVLHTFKRIVM